MEIIAKLTEQELLKLISSHFEEKTGSPCPIEKVKIEVKSSQNYKSEWERASFRASILLNL